MSPDSPNSFRFYINREFDHRKTRNAKYSLRAFARDLGVSNQKLSQILTGKLGISTASAEQIAARLKLSKFETDLFIALAESAHGRSESGRVKAAARVDKLAERLKFRDRSSDVEREGFSWLEYPIYMCYSLPEAQANHQWASRRLGIPEAVVKTIVDDFFSRDLLREENGSWIQPNPFVSVNAKSSGEAIRKLYKKMLDLASKSVSDTPITERKLSVSYMTLHPENLEVAKDAIDQFCYGLIDRFGKSDLAGARVYAFNTQLFPIDVKTGDNGL